MIFNRNTIVAALLAAVPAVLARDQNVRGLAKPTKDNIFCEFKGNGFPSKHVYQLVLNGMDKDQAGTFNPRPGDDNGRSMFVVYEGRTTIKLYNSDIEAMCDKEYKVVDADGADGEAGFCLPDPFPDCDGDTSAPCYDVPADYAVFARVVKGGGNNKMRLCATFDGGSDEYCYGGTYTLPNRKAKDVSQQLLTFCGPDGNGYGLFDNLCDDGEGGLVLCDTNPNNLDEITESYFWQLDADDLKKAQLRFYPLQDLIAANPACEAMFETKRSGGCGR